MDEAEFIAGAAEVGWVLGVEANTVNAWRMRQVGFPEPVVQLKAGAIWDIREVIAWADRTGRTVEHREYTAPTPASKTTP
ncbi:hypothetical protein ABZW11_14225 [Nonomuraea sp. NPDC004580]|uniref:hypothetical protein n=1 Tax=Nonomuraea sp. NPDC004580 TaxID=3154552 RepID=UPI00339E138C